METKQAFFHCILVDVITWDSELYLQKIVEVGQKRWHMPLCDESGGV